MEPESSLDSLIETFAEGQAQEVEALRSGIKALTARGLDQDKIIEVIYLREQLNSTNQSSVMGLSALYDFSQKFVSGSLDIGRVGAAADALREAYTAYCVGSDEKHDPRNFDTSVAIAITTAENGGLNTLESVCSVITGEKSAEDAREDEEITGMGKGSELAPFTGGRQDDPVKADQLIQLGYNLSELHEVCRELGLPVSGKTTGELVYCKEMNFDPQQVALLVNNGIPFEEIPLVISTTLELKESSLMKNEDDSIELVEATDLDAIDDKDVRQEVLEDLNTHRNAVESVAIGAFCVQFGFETSTGTDPEQLADALVETHETFGHEFLNDSLLEAVRVGRKHNIPQLERVLEMAEADRADGRAHEWSHQIVERPSEPGDGFQELRDDVVDIGEEEAVEQAEEEAERAVDSSVQAEEATESTEPETDQDEDAEFDDDIDRLVDL